MERFFKGQNLDLQQILSRRVSKNLNTLVIGFGILKITGWSCPSITKGGPIASCPEIIS